ncbi:hypothetical protein LIER_31365 [Lithospermum erythrorhizon]|uniref:Uncharacterized protein n=1 Tax=Lithospermum erythrorhizon TaxID=34254 RepID=A0AAV3RQQ9_LITER
MKKHFKQLILGEQKHDFDSSHPPLQQDFPVLNSIQNPIFGSSSSSSTQPLCPPPSKAPTFIFGQNNTPLTHSPYEAPTFIFGQNNSPPLVQPPSSFIFGQNSGLEKFDGNKKSEEENVDVVKKDSPLKDELENEVQEEEKKRWNLRPRKPSQQNHMLQNTGGRSYGTQNIQEKKNEEKKIKKKNNKDANVSIMPTFSPTLTKEEIREDFIKMTGKPPPARPKTKKKVKKEVQENLDV